MRLRRLFRFNTRTLLFAAAIVALFFAWYGNGLRIVRERSSAAQQISANGGYAANSTIVSHDWMKVREDPYDWLTDPFGEHFNCVEFGIGNGRQPVVDQQFMEAAPAIERIAPAWLGLQHAKLTSQGYAALADFTSLRGLDLSNSTVEDSDLQNICQLSELRYLDLKGTKVSDAGLAQLKSLSKLEELGLDHRHTTPEAISDLRDTLPKLILR